MSQSNSENDIWEYKPLKKTKRKDSCTSPNSHEKRAKRKKVSMRCPDKLGRNSQPCTGSAKVIDTVVGARSQTSVTVDVGPCDDRFGETAASPQVYCPVCQMPFSILVVQSQRWHVADCSETPSADRTECPDGFQCSSSIPSHYKRYSHSLLAHSRAVNSTDSISLLLDEMQNISAEQKSVGLSDPISSVETSMDSAVNLSSASNQSVSPGRDPSGSPSLTNALLLLRSPDTRDIKKRKGWSPSTKGSKQQSDSQETRTRASTPVKAEDFNHAMEPCEVKEEPSLPSEEEFISYSPLSELPAEFDACGTQPRKALFQNGALGAVGEDEGKEDDVDDDSLMLFNDMMMSDDALSDAEPHQANGGEEEPLLQTTQNTCGPLMSSLTRPSHLVSASPTGAAHGQNHPHSSPPRGSKEQHSTNITVKPKLASPQSLVLERLREQIATSTSVNGFGATCGEQNLPVNNHNPVSAKQDASSPQTFPVSSLQPLASMAPRKTQAKAGPSSLKQTDIGVFFGLKPLKEKEVKAKGGETTSIEDPYQTSAPQGSSVSPAAITTKRQGRRQKNHAAPSTTEDSGTQPPQTEGGRGGARRRWNRRRTTDGEPEEPKRCPFYKKIPGTGFTVDAFRYGLVSGITAYFLTHFHSDHYGGLKKTSTFPIYCNKITGNLVKSKLKVDEQYVHILPMNTECTVQGVRVTLLDANHCPGAAMLLFLLPDGQTVLHTGDFRADPSMERYQELLGLRVQTLYLDTTYCSPEYTFPSQEEVITFAVNTAFELVTLTPRTLVVCGTYSVGKEKVFLAVSEVLGSKVFLSKDKYNTMCCLESEAIRKRITTDMTAAQVHVLPMMQVNFKNLHSYLNRFSGKYERIVAFKPTGWTFTQVGDVEDIQPQVQGNISIYGIPYSEHSSYLELKRFVQWLRPLKIIPTVNVGSWGSRKAMEGCFREWLTETQALAPPHPAGRGAAAPPTGSPPLKTVRLHQGVVPPAM